MSLINPILRARNPLLRKLPSMSKYSSEATVTANFMHYFPVVGVAVGLTALTFQVLVLYPWHETISDDFQALEAVTRRIEKTETKLEEKLDIIMRMEDEVKAKERKILVMQAEILSKLDAILTSKET